MKMYVEKDRKHSYSNIDKETSSRDILHLIKPKSNDLNNKLSNEI